MALDAENGDVEGVEALSRRARKLGSAEDEIIEVVEIVEEICEFQGLSRLLLKPLKPETSDQKAR